MKLNKAALILLFTLITGISPAQIKTITPLCQTGNETTLNGRWKFKYVAGIRAGNDSLFYANGFDVSGWDEINVPGHWDLQGFSEPTYGELPAGLGLYKRSFCVPSDYKGQQVFIRFEGVLFAYEVFVNGEKAGEWSSSYNGASFDITGLLHLDKENLLAVRVSTRSRDYRFDISDNWALTGIYRDVELFSTPPVYIDDYTVQTSLSGENDALVRVDVRLCHTEPLSLGNRTLEAVLYSPEGKLVQKKQGKVVSDETWFEISLDNPDLWTAETPVLYSLKLFLMKDGQIQQEISQNVGIREITIENGILKLNGRPLKLRGVNTHDLIPETGKCLSFESIKRDLDLIREGNINFIRTSHYPPDRRKLDLCDSLGIYVVCEVPFSFGNELLSDTSYRHFLIQRADATVMRDKNHPSVIMWSMGNENPITQITEETGDYVKRKDPTRPLLYAGTASLNELPECADIFAPHYEEAGWVKNFSETGKRPVVMTEYAHGLGLAFGNLEDIWQEMFRSDIFAGGAIWHFQDQGVGLKTDKPVDTGKLAYDVWTGPCHYYKTTLEGADGIVYSDRTPQADFWQVRKVYSPVQIVEKKMTVVPGKQDLRVTVYNQYDFTNLSVLSGTWKLYQNSTIYREGSALVNCAPHDTVFFSLSADLPENADESVWYLRFDYKDREGCPLYEHQIELVTGSGYEALTKLMPEKDKKEKWKTKEDKDKMTLQSNSFVYEIGKENPVISVFSARNGNVLLDSPLYARAGRFPKMADVTVRDKFYPDDHNYYWDPWILAPTNVKISGQKGTSEKYQFHAGEIFCRGKDFPGERIDAELDFSIEKTGFLQINHRLTPVNATGVFLEAGVSMVMPREYNYFYWVGDGPFGSYPDKHRMNDFGIYRIHKDDINFNGNRSRVKLGLVTDEAGNGIVVTGNSENISVELKDGCIVLSQNVLLSGLGNKKRKPVKSVPSDEVENYSGVLKLLPVEAGRWPEILKAVFGDMEAERPEPFNPYYHSFDTSK